VIISLTFSSNKSIIPGLFQWLRPSPLELIANAGAQQSAEVFSKKSLEALVKRVQSVLPSQLSFERSGIPDFNEFTGA